MTGLSKHQEPVTASWGAKSPDISAFSAAARGTASSGELANIFEQAVKEHQQEFKDAELTASMIEVANEIITRFDPLFKKVAQLNDVFNWLNQHRNNQWMEIEEVDMASAADGVRSGLAKLDVEEPVALQAA